MKITREQLTQARDELEAMYRAFYKQEYGIEEGVIVVSDEKHAKRCGCDCRIEKVYVDLNADTSYELNSKPRIMVAVKSKDVWCKIPADLNGNEWKLKD